jgi:hypothetical protein
VLAGLAAGVRLDLLGEELLLTRLDRAGEHERRAGLALRDRDDPRVRAVTGVEAASGRAGGARLTPTAA